MVEIIPNWHPILVHFTLALLSISALLYLAGLVLKKKNLLIAARWNLWIGAVATVGTVLAGLYAYNTVTHDGMSHVAMTDHRNWALPTAGIFVTLAFWAAWKQRGAQAVSPAFVVIMLLATGLLAVTGYKGGEVVYRHGIGVMRMPEMHGDDDHDGHMHGHGAHDVGDDVSAAETLPADGNPDVNAHDEHDVHDEHQH